MNTVGGGGNPPGGGPRGRLLQSSQAQHAAAAAAAKAAQQQAVLRGSASGVGGVDTAQAEPSGTAALERVVAAAKAAAEEQQRSAEDQRAVCDMCNVRRADLRGPCGHKYHAREYLRARVWSLARCTVVDGALRVCL